MQADKGRDVFKALPVGCGFLAQGKGFIVAAEGLEDRRPLAIGRLGIERELLGAIDVGQGIVKPMEARACSRACEQSLCIGGRVAHELPGDLFRPLVIGNAADDQPAQHDQLDETRSRFDRGVTKPDLRLQGIDLGAEIQQSNAAVGERTFDNHDAAASGRFGAAM